MRGRSRCLALVRGEEGDKRRQRGMREIISLREMRVIYIHSQSLEYVVVQEISSCVMVRLCVHAHATHAAHGCARKRLLLRLW